METFFNYNNDLSPVIKMAKQSTNSCRMKEIRHKVEVSSQKPAKNGWILGHRCRRAEQAKGPRLATLRPQSTRGRGNPAWPLGQ